MRVVGLFLVLLLALPLARAATVHGTIYDPDLNPTQDVVLTVNTVPAQTLVSTDGTYSLNIPWGNYTLTAVRQQDSLVAQQNITIQDTGDYVVDIILMPDISEEQNILAADIQLPQLSLPSSPRKSSNPWPYAVLVVVGAAALIAVVWRRKSKKPALLDDSTDTLPEEILQFIRQSGGRTTQKEIRKHMPVSEAKVSLVLTELESKGMISKIRKGKANIILLGKSNP